ncbi:MAG: phosphatidate cytidylyltransferase [Bacteroidales bacterium]
MNKLLVRTLSGIIFVLIVLGLIIWSEYSMVALVLIIFALALFEFRRMFRQNDRLLFTVLLTTGLLTLSTAYLFITGFIGLHMIAIIAGSILLILALHYLLISNTSIRETGPGLFITLWLTGSLIFFMALGWIREPGNYDPAFLVILLSLIWVFDAAAYIFGSLFGKTQIAPSVSPGKTLEGLVSGMMFTALAGYIIFRLTSEFTALQWVMIGCVVGLGATAGDLFESKLKREAGVKDSGQIIPGHGGILDRFDSLLFTAPLFYIVILILKS